MENQKGLGLGQAAGTQFTAGTHWKLGPVIHHESSLYWPLRRHSGKTRLPHVGSQHPAQPGSRRVSAGMDRMGGRLVVELCAARGWAPTREGKSGIHPYSLSAVAYQLLHARFCSPRQLQIDHLMIYSSSFSPFLLS